MAESIQYVDNCIEHEDCEVIYLLAGPNDPSIEWNGHQVVWHSHAPSHTHVPCRIGDQTPECHDIRTGETHSWKEMCPSCAGTLVKLTE